ncbi:hypothetical protein HRbin17_01978 [bacterium HR17]|uniref:Immune inhibitor A n=1 Tax=Candidatus Fervidibacter japonicus TaxID=2035412 RepID=A0A2H5XE55_9BACT|nr:hypothetical protein HRbin17_01978 [bacterium HR17]
MSWRCCGWLTVLGRWRLAAVFIVLWLTGHGATGQSRCRTYWVTRQMFQQANITPQRLAQTFGAVPRQVGRELPPSFYGGLGSALVPTNGLVGTVRVLHILVNVINSDPSTQQLVPRLQFDPTHTPDYYNNLLFNEGNPDSMASFFREVSYGRLRLVGETLGPVAANLPLTVQTQNNQVRIAYISNLSNNATVQSLVQQALNGLDSVVDFARYDGDGDGRIDALLVTFAADVRAKPPSGDLTLDPTSGAFTVPWGVARRVNPMLPPFATTQDGVAVDVVALVHEVDSTYGFGTYAHELGHVFGLPDLYSPQNENQVDPGLWSTMAVGDRFEAPGRPLNPMRPGGFAVHYDPWCKVVWGWLTPVEVVRTVGTVTVPAYADQPVAYRIWAFGSVNQPEYFLVVNRQLRGFDRFLPTSGLNIFHIDRSILWDPARFFNNAVQANASRKGVDLVDADGRNDMDDAVPNIGTFNWSNFGFLGWQRGNWGDDGDPFPGRLNKTQFSFTTVPSSASYTGQDSGIVIENITPQGDGSVQLTVRLAIKPQAVIVSPRDGERVFTRRPLLQVQFVTPSGAPADIAPNAITVKVDGRDFPFNAAEAFDENRQLLNLPLGDPNDPTRPLPLGTHTVQVRATTKAGITVDPVQATFVVDIRRLAFNQQGNGVRMISLPYDFALNPSLGAPAFVLGNAFARIARWGVLDAVNQLYGYHVFGAFVDHFVPGRAYWVQLTADATFYIEGTTVDRTQPFRITNEPVWDRNALDRGWQQIGNPFPFSVDATAIQVVTLDGTLMSLSEAVSRQIIGDTVFSFTGNPTSPYLSIPIADWVMEPFEGYWLLKRQPCSLIVAPSPSIRRRLAPLVSSPSVIVEVWGEGASLPYRLAVHRDAFTVPAPPPAPGMTGWASFVSPTRGALPLMEVSLKTHRQWTVVVQSHAPRQKVTLRWRLPSALRDGRLVLVDPQTLQTVSLAVPGSLTVTTDEQGQKTLTLRWVAEDGLPLRIVDVRWTKLRGQGVLIQARLTAPAQVQAEIRTLTGRLVRLLPPTEPSRSAVQWVWDGRGADGRPLALTTPLLLHLRARDLAGRETQRVVILR